MDNFVNRFIQHIPLFFALFFLALPIEVLATPDKGPVTVTLKVVGSQPSVGNQFQVELTAVSVLDVKDANAEFKVEGGLTLINTSGLNLGDLKAQVPKTATAVIRVDKSGELQVYGSVQYRRLTGSAPTMVRTTLLYLLATPERVWVGEEGFTALKVDRLNERRSRGAVSDKDYQKELEAIHTGEVSSSRSATPPPDPALTEKQRRDQQLYDLIKSKQNGGSDKESKAVERDPRSISVTGTLKWKDGAGGTHAVRFAKVELFNSDTNAVINSGATGADGTVSISFTPSASIQNVKLKFYSRAALFALVKSNAGVTYSVVTTAAKPTAGVADGSTLAYGDLVMGNNSDLFNAFSVLDGVLEVALYAGSSLPGITISEIPVFFPSKVGNGSFFDPADTSLNIGSLDRYDWDVLSHEYGHYIGKLTGIEGGIGGQHFFGTNMIGITNSDGHTYTRDEGLRLEFGEGFPTFFGLAVHQLQHTSVLHVPHAGDTTYEDIEDINLTSNIENTDADSVGEDCENSVFRALWDIYDSNSDAGDNGVSVAFTTIFSALDAANPHTVSAAWNTLTTGLTTAQLVDYGNIFAQQKISPNPTSPGDNTPPTARTAPTFQWNTQGAGTGQHLNVFNVEFYDKTFGTLIHESADITTSVNDTTATYTPSDSDWTTILSNTTDGNVIAWFVKGKSNANPNTGIYASPAKYLNGLDIGFVIDDTGSMSEEIGGVRSALTAFITALSGSSSHPIIELVTFKDDVTSRITSNNLTDVQTQVSSLFASGGGDCPEASVEALSFIAPHIKNGGKVLFVTDADPHPGTDIGAVISEMRAKGVRVDVLLSGDCETSFRSAEGKTKLASCNNDGYKDRALRAQNAINGFSRLAIETGGAFITAEEVNSGGSGTTMYEKAAENVMLGIIEPRITTIFPQQVPLGATLDVLLTGSNTNFSTGSVATFSTGTRGLVSPFTINSQTFLSASRMRLNITVPADATLGFYDVSVQSITSRAVETALGTSLLEVVSAPSAPQIIGITPAAIEEGATKTVTFYGIGTHFASGSTLSFTAADGFSTETKLTVQSGTLSAVSATQLTAQVKADSDADLGFRKVTISAAPSTRSAIPPRITPASSSPARASIASVTPSSAKQGISGTISITGTATTFDGTSTVSFSGSGITAFSPSVTDSTHLSVFITIDPSAAAGFRDVTVTTGSEVATITNGFEVLEVANSSGPELFLVTAASSSSTTASVSSVSPSSAQQGKSGTITIIGSNTNFIDGTSTVSFSGSGITVSSTTVTDSTHLTADIQIDSTASAGFRDVFVTTGAEVASKLDGFEVIATIPALSTWGILIALVLVSLVLVYQLRTRRRRQPN